MERKVPSIAILTSGGDSQGMNAAVRAATRMALEKGADIYGVYEGYDGLVQGGDKIRKLMWDDVGGILSKGGTMIGSARSAAFRTPEGRRKAASELMKRNIDSLIVIGGDGSLTGADIFRQEWPEHVKALAAENPGANPFLRIVGLVGSIDNDMCGTDYTIGSDSALHRITEAVDAILSTASSHQRTFVLEVMGRNCGGIVLTSVLQYLALTTALTSGADYCIVPEIPPKAGWEEEMCNLLDHGRKSGKRCSLVIVAEGAVDLTGKRINAEQVKKEIETRLKHDTRVTLLGHVQRGGTPSAFDRNMSSLMGVAAVNAAFEIGNESVLIGMVNNRFVRSPLMECVSRTRAVADALAKQDFATAARARGESFLTEWHLFNVLAGHPIPTPTAPKLRIGVLTAGAASPGMNTVVRALVRTALSAGHGVYAIPNGFLGMLKGEISEFSWMTVNGWAIAGGSYLGANRRTIDPSNAEAVGEFIQKSNLNALVMIGGFEGYQTVHMLQQHATKFPALAIPMLCVPASISNALPGTEITIGSDTALNSIIWALDRIKQSAVSSQRVFIVEVMGSYSGYLAAMASLAGGAERMYLHEDGVTLKDVQADISHLKKRFENKKKNMALYVRNENASPTYTTQTLVHLFEAESEDLFDVRHCILGHIQQGGYCTLRHSLLIGNPSPMDRLFATRLAEPLVRHLEAHVQDHKTEPHCVGLVREQVVFTPLADALATLDPKFRRPKEQWWSEWRPAIDVLLRSAPKRDSGDRPRLQRAWTSSQFGGKQSGVDS